ncbi:MAG: TolC family protein [Verrucomicrobiota bacterium]
MNLRRVFLPPLLSAAFCLASAAAADTPLAPAVPPLTLEESVARALDKNFDLQIQRYSVRSAADSVVIADAVYNTPTLTASATAAGGRSAALGAVIPGTENSSQSPRVGISQRLDTGATLGLGAGVARTVGAGSPYGGSLTLDVRQPLLQGAGKDVNRAARDKARLGVKVADSNFKDSVLTVVHDVEVAYYNLVFAREQLKVRQFSFDVAQRLLDENTTRLQAGDRTQLDVLQSRVAVENARLTVVTAIQSVRDREDALLRLIGRFAFDTPIGPVAFGDEPVSAVSVAQSYARARNGQPEMVSSQLNLSQLRLDVLTADNARKPALDLGASLGLTSRERSAVESAEQVFTGRGNNWQLGLTLTLPWELKAENARYRQSLLSLDSAQTRYEQLDQTLLTQVRSAVRAVETGRENVAIAALARDLSQQQYDRERARYDAGLSTVRLLRDAEADLNNAKISELQLRVSLRTALAELARLETSSLDRYKIKLGP